MDYDFQQDEVIPSNKLSELREQGLKSLYFFAKGILGFDFIDSGMHLELCEILEKFYLSTDLADKRLKITLPRGFLKTTIASISFPIWCSLHYPDIRILLAQNTYTNAVAKLNQIKGIFESHDLFKMLYPEHLPDVTCTWKAGMLCVKRDGKFPENTFEAAGTRTQIISRHYDIIIEDDTVAPDLKDNKQEVVSPSADDVRAAIGWHRLAQPLLINPGPPVKIPGRAPSPSGGILVVGTRWAELDLLSWIDENEHGTYKSYTRACREDDEGKSDPQGHLTYESRFNDQALEMLHRGMGEYLFSALYYNTPLKSSQQLFKPEWIHTYETYPGDLICYTTVDLANDPEEVKAEPDYNIVLTTGKSLSTGVIYILEYWREQTNPGAVITEIFRHVSKYSPIKVGVEGVQYQRCLKFFIKQRQIEKNMAFFIESILHGGKAKGLRIAGLQPLFEDGQILIRTHMTELRQELLAFPLGKNDDIIDALAMQLDVWTQIRSTKEIVLEKPHEKPFTMDKVKYELTQRWEKEHGASSVFHHAPFVPENPYNGISFQH